MSAARDTPREPLTVDELIVLLGHALDANTPSIHYCVTLLVRDQVTGKTRTREWWVDEAESADDAGHRAKADFVARAQAGRSDWLVRVLEVESFDGNE